MELRNAWERARVRAQMSFQRDVRAFANSFRDRYDLTGLTRIDQEQTGAVRSPLITVALP